MNHLRKEHLPQHGRMVTQVDLSHPLLINQPSKMAYHVEGRNRESVRMLTSEIEKNKSQYNFS